MDKPLKSNPQNEELLLCPECNGPLLMKIEKREGGYHEEVLYCNNCGHTATV